jgi:hypothetical protein
LYSSVSARIHSKFDGEKLIDWSLDLDMSLGFQQFQWMGWVIEANTDSRPPRTCPIYINVILITLIIENLFKKLLNYINFFTFFKGILNMFPLYYILFKKVKLLKWCSLGPGQSIPKSDCTWVWVWCSIFCS